MLDPALETELSTLWLAGAHHDLVTRLVRSYGPEILSYFFASLRGEGEAGEAFSQFTLNVWEAIPRFRGDASFRTWAYALARHAVGRIVRERGKRKKHVNLSSAPELDALAARVRSETVDFMRTETRSRVAALRDSLDPDDQTLLILRVDRRFTWPDVARVMAGEDEELDEDQLGKRVVALRKRFERLKNQFKKQIAGG